MPYKGTSFALNGLLAGDVQGMFDTISTSIPLIETGQVRALEGADACSLRRDLSDIELVIDVAVQAEALVVKRADRLACQLEWNRNVPQPLPADRFCDDGALVANDWVVQARLQRIPADRAEHAAGDEDDMNTTCVRPLDRGARPHVQRRVLADQCPVEVARYSLDVTWEVRRKLQCFVVRNLTSAAI